MSKRRLIMYNDARHFHMYIYEPPMRLQDAWGPQWMKEVKELFAENHIIPKGVFQVADKNHENSVTVSQFESGLHFLNIEWSRQQLDLVEDCFRVPGSRRIDYAWFCEELET